MCQRGKRGQSLVTSTRWPRWPMMGWGLEPAAFFPVLCVNSSWRQKPWSLVWSFFSDDSEPSSPSRVGDSEVVSLMEKKQRKEMKIEIVDSVNPKLNFFLKLTTSFLGSHPFELMNLCLPYQARKNGYRRRNELHCPWVPPSSFPAWPECTQLFIPFCFGWTPHSPSPSMLIWKSESPGVLANAACASTGPCGNSVSILEHTH